MKACRIASGVDFEECGYDQIMVNRIEQDAKADLLAVMLFADAWFSVKKRGL